MMPMSEAAKLSAKVFSYYHIFIDVGHFQKKKAGQIAAGDVFITEKSMGGRRIFATLSDGLGSGIKANVLASLTATMMTKFVQFDIPIRRAAEIIINTLPVCSECGLSYATCTLLDIQRDNCVHIIEYDNPPALVVRGGQLVNVSKEQISIERKNKDTGPKNENVYYSIFTPEHGDRIIFFSDGVTQAAMGSDNDPRGWGMEGVVNFIVEQIENTPDISSRLLSKNIVEHAVILDRNRPKDDITCGVVYFRKPRDLLVITGPPFNPNDDVELGRVFSEFNGKKILSGGTTAEIISKMTGKKITWKYSGYDPKIPPASAMDGADLVCEGIITLGAVAELLQAKSFKTSVSPTPAEKTAELLLESDRICFVVGTKINEAHQDPHMPVELELRRIVVKRIAALLEERYMKAIKVQYV
jgi:hypothetical protein